MMFHQLTVFWHTPPVLLFFEIVVEFKIPIITNF